MADHHLKANPVLLVSPDQKQIDDILGKMVSEMHKSAEETMLYGGSGAGRISSKHANSMAAAAPNNITATEIAARLKELGDYQWDQMKVNGKHASKKHFVALAEEMQAVERGLEVMGLGKPKRDEIMELVCARVGMACHKSNKEFDSFKFNAVARKRKP